MKFIKFAIASLMLLSMQVFAGDFVTFNNNMNKINLDQVAYVSKGDGSDGAVFNMTNGAASAVIPGAYNAIMSNSKFMCDGNYYASATNKAKCVNKNLVIKADRVPGYQGNSQVNYTLVGGYVVSMDMGSESFLGSIWSAM